MPGASRRGRTSGECQPGMGFARRPGLGRGSGARPRRGHLRAGAGRASATCAPLHLGTRRPWIPGDRNHGIAELGLCSPRPQRQRPTGDGVSSFLYPSVPGGIRSWDLAMRSEQPSPPPRTPKRALRRGCGGGPPRLAVPGPELFPGLGAGPASRPPSLQSAEPLIPREVPESWGAGGGSGLGVAARAVSKRAFSAPFPLRPPPPPPAPRNEPPARQKPRSALSKAPEVKGTRLRSRERAGRRCSLERAPPTGSRAPRG